MHYNVDQGYSLGEGCSVFKYKKCKKKFHSNFYKLYKKNNLGYFAVTFAKCFLACVILVAAFTRLCVTCIKCKMQLSTDGRRIHQVVQIFCRLCLNIVLFCHGQRRIKFVIGAYAGLISTYNS